MEDFRKMEEKKLIKLRPLKTKKTKTKTRTILKA